MVEELDIASLLQLQALSILRLTLNHSARWSFGEPIFANLELVDDTLGASIFNGQSDFYVQLDNGAFFNPGTPTIINGLNATYDGFRPSLVGGILSEQQLEDIEGKLFDYGDNITLGQIFVGFVPDLQNVALTFDDIQDIFRQFGAFSGPESGLNLTITGLPGLGGGSLSIANNLASIEPAAGDSPESLANIEPAAGGDDEGQQPGTTTTSCLSDALDAAGRGQAVTYQFGGTFSDTLLEGEASCGS